MAQQLRITCQCRRHSLIPDLGRCPAEGNGNPLQYSCLGNPIDRGASWAIVYGIIKIQTQLSEQTVTTTKMGMERKG